MHTVLTCEQMRSADRYTIERLGVPSRALMERAGHAIAQEVHNLAASCGAKTVLAVCGGGNNGGDGWCAARFLSELGYETAVVSLSEHYSDDCRQQRDLYRGKILNSFPEEQYDIIIDAIFGTGFHGIPQGVYADAISAINNSTAKVVSADIPSGLNGDSGLGEMCVDADITVAIGELKSGLLLQNGADVCGKIVRKDIGIELPKTADTLLCEASDFVDSFSPRKKNTHKGSYGKAVIFGGSVAYSGAAFLSASAALRCGCGLTQLVVPNELFPYCIGKLPDAILTSAPSEQGCFSCDTAFLRTVAESADSIAIGMGCGVSKGVYQTVVFLLEQYTGTLLLDADALNCLAEFGVSILKNKKCNVIITPHPKEFSRLSGLSVSEVLENGLSAAKDFAKEYGITVLLKGHTSIITDGEVVILNNEGCAALAKGGSGDVLSGIICSLAARGVAPMKSAACGSFLLGRSGIVSAELLGEYSVTPSDVISNIPRAISSLQK